jgi:hypothetical protein
MSDKAYVVSGRNEDDGMEVVFAESPSKAKNGTTNLLGWNEWTDLRAKRAPEFDQYAQQGWVPDKALLEHNWWLEQSCTKCNKYVRLQYIFDGDGPKPLVEFDEAGNIASVTCLACLSKEVPDHA